jgi:uncharacterized membrane protein
MVSWGVALGALGTVVNGVAAGIMLSTVIGIVPMMRALPYPGYVRMVQFMRPRYDPIMPLSNGSALLIDVALIASGQRAAGPHIAAAVLLAVVITISVSKNVPVNRYLMSLDPDDQPKDWTDIDPRKRWQRWNNIRTGCAVLACLCNAVALIS